MTEGTVWWLERHSVFVDTENRNWPLLCMAFIYSGNVQTIPPFPSASFPCAAPFQYPSPIILMVSKCYKLSHIIITTQCPLPIDSIGLMYSWAVVVSTVLLSSSGGRCHKNIQLILSIVFVILAIMCSIILELSLFASDRMSCDGVTTSTSIVAPNAR